VVTEKTQYRTKRHIALNASRSANGAISSKAWGIAPGLETKNVLSALKAQFTAGVPEILNEVPPAR
jgi:hypothetical protein